MNRKQADLAAVWRGRIAWLQEKRKVFFEGRGRDENGSPIGTPGADFAIEVYRGESKPSWWSAEDAWVHIGKLKSAIRAAIPSLLYSNPEYKVFPAAQDIVNGADVAYERSKAKAAWLNHIYRESSGNQHVRNAINNAFFSIGVIKAGYRCHFQDDTDRGVFAKTEDGEYILDAWGDPTLERGKFLKINGELVRDEYNLPIPHPGKLAKEEWFLEAVDPKAMLFDVERGSDFFQHRFVIEEWVRPLEEVKADPRFSAAVRKRLTATETIHGPATARKSDFDFSSASKTVSSDNRVAVEADEARIRGYDIYDFQTQRYMVLAESNSGDENSEFLLDDNMPPGMEHGPYRFLKFTEDVGTEWYPIPDATDMALVNQEYNMTRSQMVIHREHTKTRYLELPGAFEGEGVDAEEERAKAAHGPDGTFIKVAGNNVLFPMPKAQIDGSFFQAIPNIGADFNEVGGMPGEMRGVSDADTATQASILATGAETRNNDRRDNQVAQFLNEVGRMLLMSGQANAELDTIVVEKVTEQEGVAPFRAVQLSPKELVGEFAVTVAIGSTMAKNDPRVLQSVQAMLANIGQNPVVGLFKGLNRRLLDGMGLDPVLADEIWEASMAYLQSQQKDQGGSPEGVPAQQGQELPQMLGGVGNAAGGAPVGAPIN